jgi:hypothetical protein
MDGVEGANAVVAGAAEVGATMAVLGEFSEVCQ